MSSYRREIIDLLERNGYHRLPDRGKGSHEAWSNGKRTQIVPRISLIATSPTTS